MSQHLADAVVLVHEVGDLLSLPLHPLLFGGALRGPVLVRWQGLRGVPEVPHDLIAGALQRGQKNLYLGRDQRRHVGEVVNERRHLLQTPPTGWLSMK